MNEVICLGDLFRECIKPFPPATHPTTVVGPEHAVLGGNAYNICWNLAQLGMGCRLVAPFSQRHEALVARSVLGPRDRRGIIWGDGESDLLMAFVAPDRHRSLYLRGDLPHAVGATMVRRATSFAWAILAGSRHKTVREAFARLALRRRAPALVFTPSYTAFEYERDILRTILAHAAVVILNESEARHVCAKLGARTSRALARRVKGTLIITYADRGSVAFLGSDVVRIESISRRKGDVVGAGDAFLAAYLRILRLGGTEIEALRFATATGAIVAEAGAVRVRLPVRTIAGRVASHRWGVTGRRPPR